MVDDLLSAGAEVSCVDENANSALHLASFYGNTEAVELLLAVDADIAVSRRRFFFFTLWQLDWVAGAFFRGGMHRFYFMFACKNILRA